MDNSGGAVYAGRWKYMRECAWGCRGYSDGGAAAAGETMLSELYHPRRYEKLGLGCDVMSPDDRI